jgi:hypothetical protein
MDQKEDKKAADIVWCFRQALTDLISLLTVILILITGFRAIYLITILSLNGHVTMFNNGFLRRLARNNPRLHLKLMQIQALQGVPVTDDRRNHLLTLK